MVHKAQPLRVGAAARMNHDRQAYVRSRKKLMYSIAVISIILLCILAFAYQKTALRLSANILLFLFGACSGLISKKLVNEANWGIDFLPFAAVCFFLVDDFTTGMIAAVGMGILSSILTGSMSTELLCNWLGFAAAGVLSIFFPQEPFWYPMILVGVYHLVSNAIADSIGADTPHDIIAIPANLLIHYVLFKYAGVFVMSLI